MRKAARVEMGASKAMLTCPVEHQKRVVDPPHEMRAGTGAGQRACSGRSDGGGATDLDEVIALIRKSKSPKEAKEQLIARFDLTDIQAQAILDMRLQRLTGLEIEALRKEYAAILKTIARLEGILKSEKKLDDVIRQEMTEIRDQIRRRTPHRADRGRQRDAAGRGKQARRGRHGDSAPARRSAAPHEPAHGG